MNPKEAKNDIYQIVPCPICQGTGKIAEKKCFDCQGFKAVLFNGVNFLVWRREISASRISRDKIKKLISNLILLSLFIFGGAGIISLGWEIYYFSQAHLPISQIYQQKSWPLFIFWLSILSDLFIFYHFQRDLEKNKVISWQNEFNPKKRRLIAAESLNHLPKNTQDIGDYYSLLARQVLDKAWQQAGRFENDQVEPIHLFIALLSFNKIQTIFSRLGVPFPSIKKRIENALAKLPHQDSQAPRISDKIIDIIYTSYLNALANHQDKVDIIEIFETLAQQPNEVKELLYDLDITPDKINNVVAWMRINKQLLKNWQKFKHKAGLRPKNRLNRSMTAIATPVLDKFSQDLTALAQNGYLMPCIGREKEIQEIFNVLSGGPRRSALLLGFPGVGKNTIIEGIAQKMVEEDVPDFLQDMRLVSLSVAKLVSGTDPASAQGRLMAILNEIRRSGNILLFVGDIQNMIGITAGRQGSIDLADVLAQVLATNSVLALATALPGDYKHYIEGQSSLDNVFEKVNIEETSGDEAIRILEAKAGSIEYHESIFFSYGAIAETIKLSSRYLHDRFLPEKAIQILQEAAAMVKNSKGKNSMVLANDIAALISSKTNIPLTEITIQESEKLLNLEDKIHERLINQEEAVKMVATSLRRARAEMRDLARPISNFLFLGPTGVGKTELAKAVAEVYFGAEKNMIRLDMSEYQDKSSLSRLIGAPPGFADSQAGGFLTEAVRKNPFSLILLDEIEKAHPDILNIFLQIFDDGRLTDSTGRTIDFTNTIIIATSNAGSIMIQELVQNNVALEEVKQQLIDKELNNYFRPEFLNRFDGIIVFKPLTIVEVKQIAILLLNKIKSNMAQKGIDLIWTDVGLAYIAQAGFDPKFGARPLKRVIQEIIQDQLANLLISNKISRRDQLVIDDFGKIIINKAEQI